MARPLPDNAMSKVIDRTSVYRGMDGGAVTPRFVLMRMNTQGRSGMVMVHEQWEVLANYIGKRGSLQIDDPNPLKRQWTYLGTKYWIEENAR